MARIVVSEFLTLDGVMQAPGDPNEDRSGGFEHGGWQLAFFDDIFGKAMTDSFAETGGLLLGRRTYDIFAAHWPNQPEDDPLGGIMNRLPKHVVSTTLEEPLAWQNSTLIKDDVVEALRALRAEHGKDLLVFGSGELVQALIANGLVDEYRLMIHPIVLGTGKKLFRDGTEMTRLQLKQTMLTTTSVLMNSYVPAEG
jgi:dihydrofolate reductase